MFEKQLQCAIHSEEEMKIVEAKQKQEANEIMTRWQEKQEQKVPVM